MHGKLKLFIRICMVLILAGTLYMIWLIADITWKQYQDTRDWQNTAYTGEIKDVEPFLAKNYIKTDEREAVAVWQQLDQALSEIDASGGIPEDKVGGYKSLLEESKSWQEAYGLGTGEIPSKNSRLSLYLELEELLPTVYETPAAEQLQQLTNRLYTAQMEADAPVHAEYFERLKVVAADYQNLSLFLSNFMPRLGTIEDGILSVDKQVGKKTTQDLVGEIEEHSLQKFPFIADLYKLLKGEQWDNVLKRNEITRAYEAWNGARSQLESYGKSEYYAASSVATYQDALDMGLDVYTQEKEGYTIDPASPVYTITCNGVIITKDQYIRYGTPVIVTLKEKYVKDQEEETGGEKEDPEEETEQPKPDSQKPVTGGNNPKPTTKPDDWDEDWDETDKKPVPTKPPASGWDEDW